MFKVKFFSKQKDKIVLLNSVVVVIDGMVTAFDNSINGGVPALAIAWGLSKGLYGASIQLRQERAVEFVEMIIKNPSIFTKEILSSQEFQDGFVYTFEKYLTQRAEYKRKIIQRVFLGFGIEEHKQDFKLERLLSTIDQVSVNEIEAFRVFGDGSIRDWHKSQFPDAKEEELIRLGNQPLNIGQIGKHILSEMKGKQEYEDQDYALEILSRLESLGLLIAGIQAAFDFSSSTFKISQFGKEFVEFVTK
jgi:hypothetical protein